MDEQLTWPTITRADPHDELHAAHTATVTLGWSGIVLPQITLFGCRLLPVVVPDADAHHARTRDGDPPQLDPDTLTIWQWPQYPAPPPAIRLAGALFLTGQKLRSTLGDARRWRAFGPSALLVPPALTEQDWLPWECALHGIGLAFIDTPGGVLQPEPGRRAPARRRTADRWIEEKLYAHALDHAILPDGPPHLP